LRAAAVKERLRNSIFSSASMASADIAGGLLVQHGAPLKIRYFQPVRHSHRTHGVNRHVRRPALPERVID